MSKADEYLKQIDTLDKLKQAAIDELKGIIAEATEKLTRLGITEEPRKTGIKRPRDPNKPCPICGEKGHDGRFHRSDKAKKKKVS
jgi:hypothetical protein